MDEVNLLKLLRMLLKRWWILALSAAVLGSAAYAYTNYYLVPIYESYTTLYVGKNAESSGLAMNDLYLGSYLLSDYREIAKSKQVAYEVIRELNLKTSAASLAGRINVAQKNDTRVIQISITDTNPKMAMDIANKVAEVFKTKVVEIMQVEIVQVIDKAELPAYPISPDEKRNIMMGIIFGVALGVGIVFLIEFFNNTVKTPEDIQKYTGLAVIGAIPAFQSRGRRI